MNSGEQKIGKMTLQLSKNQKVPNLVSIRDVNSQDTRNRLLLQARNHLHPTQQLKIQSLEQTIRQQSLKKEQRDENEEMQIKVKELAKQLQKLNEVNQGLIVRIKQVEAAYHNLRGHLQHEYQQQKSKLKNQIYSQVQQYVKRAVQKVTHNLKQERMAPSLEDKLERFMIELIEINPISVEQYVRKEMKEDVKGHTSQRISNQRADRYLTELATSKRNMPSKEQYSSLMKRLNGQDTMTNSNVEVSKFTSSSQDTRLRTIFAVTPQKRRRIF